MTDVKRSERVASEIAAILSKILREGVRDPRVGPLTITSVRVTDDLRQARINFVPLGGEGDADEILDGLISAQPWIRRELGKRIRLRYLPKLFFHIDDQLDKAMHVSQLLDQLAAEREERPDPAEGGAEGEE